MKESMDCGLLMLPQYVTWMRQLIADCNDSRGRLTLHALALDGTRWREGGGGQTLANLPHDWLGRAALQLKRYDVCLLPVTLDTLGWTRLALASAGDALRTPVIGLVRDLRAGGLRDLLSLGMADFLRHPVCPEELKIRLALLSAAGAHHGHSLREPAVSPQPPARKKAASSRIDKVVEDMLANGSGEPFRSAKARLVTEFERHYISSLLTHHHGNISQAAKAASKNRRAFWELMRKHQIAADSYRAQSSH